jgi:hypothetical protein
MTALVQSVRRAPVWTPLRLEPIVQRSIAVTILFVLVAMVPGGWQLTLDALSEAFLAVSVFVAGTLALVHAAESAFKMDIGVWLSRYHRWQVLFAALMGAFPGCGGAIVAITQYTRGYLSFGGVVATLTATMGDAMFLLLAREPMTGLGVLSIAVVTGIISGYTVDALHGDRFMRPIPVAAQLQGSGERHEMRWRPADRFLIMITVPGLLIGILAAFQIDVDETISAWMAIEPAYWLGVTGAVLMVMLWMRNGRSQNDQEDQRGVCPAQRPAAARVVIDDTNFITAWVVFAFVGYELAISGFGIDLGTVFDVWGPIIPAIAILVGFIPGCGPQIVVTSLYLAGSLPLSAQLGNAIANDGDALFPAIAIAPKAALMATFYSAAPAIVVAYGWYFLFEEISV